MMPEWEKLTKDQQESIVQAIYYTPKHDWDYAKFIYEATRKVLGESK